MQKIVDDNLNIDSTSNSSEFLLPFPCELSILQEKGCWQGMTKPERPTLDKIVGAALHQILPQLRLHIDPSSLGIEISFLFSNDAQIQKLNKEYRAKDSPTNVLSFPQAQLSTESLQETLLFQEPLLLGDIAFAEETIKREAAEQNKTFHDHLTHLVVHGVLHLAGFDHIEEEDAEHMESLEIEILKNLHMGNPYISAPKTQEAF